MDLKWIVNTLPVRHNNCVPSYKSDDDKLVLKLYGKIFETIGPKWKKETEIEREVTPRHSDSEWRECTCNRGNGGKMFPQKVVCVRKYMRKPLLE